MKLEKIAVKNFRNLADCEFHFNEVINFVVGRNNIGKSNLLVLFDKIFKYNRFQENDYNNLQESIKIELNIKLEENEFGIFEDLFTPENNSLIKLLIEQQDPFSEIEVSHVESGTSMPSKSLKYINYILYDSIRDPKKTNDFNNKSSSYNIIPLMVDNFYQNNDQINLFSSTEQVEELLEYLNNNLKKIKTIKMEDIELLIQNDNQLESVKRLMFLGDGNSTPIDKLGSGIQYANIIPFNVISDIIKHSRYKKTFPKMVKYDSENKKYIEYVMGLDEPEIHLHPHLQRNLMNYLISIFSGENEEINSLLKELLDIDYLKGQIVVATHSPNIILDDYKTVTRMFHSNNELTVKSGEAIDFEKDNEKKFLYKFMPFIKNGFFSKVIILVEGDSELLALQEFSGKMNVDLNLNEIEVVSADGKGSIPTLSELFRKFGVKTVALFDRDQTNNENTNYNHLPDSFFTEQEEFEDEIISTMSGFEYLSFVLELGSAHKKGLFTEIDLKSDKLKCIQEQSRNLDDFVTKVIDFYSSKELLDDDLDKLLEDNIDNFTKLAKKQKSVITGQLLAYHVDEVPRVFRSVIKKAVELSNE